MNVNPGELNKSISIVQKVKTVDADGYETYQWQTVHSCKAKFTRTSGTEVYKANADMTKVNARFLIRYTATAITRKMFVLYDSTYYEIEYVNDYGDSREYIEIWASLLTTGANI